MNSVLFSNIISKIKDYLLDIALKVTWVSLTSSGFYLKSYFMVKSESQIVEIAQSLMKILYNGEIHGSHIGYRYAIDPPGVQRALSLYWFLKYLKEE